MVVMVVVGDLYESGSSLTLGTHNRKSLSMQIIPEVIILEFAHLAEKLRGRLKVM